MALYLHHVPGRLRVRSPVLKRNEGKADDVRRLLEAAEGVISVKVNAITGSITIHYDPATVTKAGILAILRGQDCLPSEAELARQNESSATPAARIGRTFGETAAKVLVEMMIERFAAAAVGALI